MSQIEKENEDYVPNQPHQNLIDPDLYLRFYDEKIPGHSKLSSRSF